MYEGGLVGLFGLWLERVGGVHPHLPAHSCLVLRLWSLIFLGVAAGPVRWCTTGCDLVLLLCDWAAYLGVKGVWMKGRLNEVGPNLFSRRRVEHGAAQAHFLFLCLFLCLFFVSVFVFVFFCCRVVGPGSVTNG